MQADIREIDLSWELEAAEPAAADPTDRPHLQLLQGGAHLVEITAEPGRSDHLPPLPGLPPMPDPRAVLASRILRRFGPETRAAQLACAVVRASSPTPEDDSPPPAATPSRRAGALPAPARAHVALASLRRHGAVCHIGPARRPSHARVAEVQPPQQRLGTPVPLPRVEDLKIKRGFWSRLFQPKR